MGLARGNDTCRKLMGKALRSMLLVKRIAVSLGHIISQCSGKNSKPLLLLFTRAK